MKLRYPAAVLIVLCLAGGFGYIFLLVASVGIESEEPVERIGTYIRICGWTWFVSFVLLAALLIYRWFIVPSPHGRE